MGTLNEMLGNAGVPHQLEYNGKVYTFSLIDQRIKAAYEKHMYEREKAALTLLRNEYRPEEYEKRLDALTQRYLDNEFSFLSETGLAHFKRSSEGKFFLLSAIAGCTPNELIDLVVARTTEVTALLDLIIKESFPGTYEKMAKAPTEQPQAEVGDTPPKAG